MPYLVTMHPVHAERSMPRGQRVGRAVATLEDAQAYVSGVVSARTTSADNRGARKTAADRLWSLPESGGEIGPLPDGTLVEIDYVNWADMAKSIGKPYSEYDWRADELIDAFNAASER